MKYHPDIELLLKYTNGHLAPALSVAIGLHYHQCEQCQKNVQDLETIGGSTLEALADTQTEQTGFDRLLDDIGDFDTSDFAAAERVPDYSAYESLAVASQDLALVEKLDKQNFEDMKWEKVTRNIWRAPVKMSDDGYQVELLKFSPNAKIPKHTHNGKEFTLVLQGDFSDHRGTYPRGEFIEQDESNEHQPVAGDQGCVCLAVTDAPLKFTGTFGPVLNWLAR